MLMKKDFLNLRRSRWLLLSLFALFVGVSPAVAQDVISVNFNDWTTSNFKTTFNSASDNATDWYVIGGTISSSDQSGNYDILTGTKYADDGKLVQAAYGSSNSAFIVTPKVTGDVTFKVRRYNTKVGSINVYEAIESGSTFERGDEKLASTKSYSQVSTYTVSYAWETFTVSLGDEGKRLAIQVVNAAIDDFSGMAYVEETYKRPSALTASSITISSAEINWEAPETDETLTGWNLEYKKSADDVWTELHNLGASTLSYSLSGLEDNTSYDVRVSALYGGNESKWKTASFKTLLAPISSYPWTEDFTGLASGIPDGWDNSEGTTTTASYKWTYFNGGHDASPCLRFDSFNNTSGIVNFLKTPVMNFTKDAVMQLKFWYKNPKGGDFSVYISNDGGATYTEELATGLTGASDWTEKKINLPTGTYYNNVVIVFKGTSNWGNGDAYIYLDDITVKNADVPELTVDPTTAADFGTKIKAQPEAKTYTITNSGMGTLTGTITSSDAEKFTVSQSSFSLGAGASMTFDVNLVFDANYGAKAATITIHPTNDGLGDVVINSTATTIDPNVWTEDFEGGSLPIGWTKGTWTISTYSSYENKTTMALAPSGSTAGTIITPCLTAKAGDVLTWDGYFNWSDEAMTVEYSNDNQETWTKIYDAYKAESEFGSTRYNHKEMSFTAPADGDYYLRFISTYQNGVDNFCGFKLNLPDHIMAITASNIPASGSYSPSMKATKSFNATVTVKESRGVAETGVVAKLYMGSTVIGTSDPVDFEANESKQITIECTPAEAATEGVEMHIEVEYAGGTLSTTPETRYVAELVRLDMTEGSVSEITTGYSAVYDLVTLTRNFVNGWNTFVAPCQVTITDIHADAIAYSFTNFADGALQFNKVTSATLNPATPYIIYVPEKLDNKVLSWESPVIYSTYVGEENVKTTHGDVTFQGTYAPIAAGGIEGKYGVTADGRIAPASSAASLKGFRAYFSGVPAGARIALFGEDDVPTGIRFIDGAAERSAEGVYNLNGQRVQNVKKGLYIQNGRKVVIK